MTVRLRGLGVDYGPTDQQLGVTPEQQSIMAGTATLAQQLDQVQAQLAVAQSRASANLLTILAVGFGTLFLLGALKR